MYDFSMLMKDVDELRSHSIVRVHEIGQSVLNKPIVELQIGEGETYVHMNASFHANEWITSAVVMAFVRDYVQALKNKNHLVKYDVQQLYKKTTLSVVPMVNPDGVDLVLHGKKAAQHYEDEVLHINEGNDDFSQWKANIRGVDLNNQFPAKWEVEKERKIPKVPAPRDFPGFLPLTEPEAQAMAELTIKRDFFKVLAFHTQGKEIYWGYEQCEPLEAEEEVNEFAKWSGYTPVRYIDSHAGYRDWFIFNWKRRGYTIELGEGVNPLPFSQFQSIYNDSIGIFVTALART
ncbi:carboxypeptidase [Anoxybacillus flavithermus AK1]|uniref:Carboxypeptidase n=2 Tax=Anoxybacillus flavithermus TaxID=33934 RepID=M8D8H2_9BACL|nr:M14 family metallocarboxypeptidase [Anoxybacillus flavithermus]EMT47157.1 carboxypeptidase [Anoxybacillus flavithermus AK1]